MALQAREAAREDFAALLDESLRHQRHGRRRRRQGHGRRDREGPRRHRRRPEDRRPRRAQGIRRAPAAKARSRSATMVEVYLERVENALGEAVLSREKARREESWVRLEKCLQQEREGHRRHLQPGQGRLHRRPRRRRRLPAAQPGRHPPGARRRPADEHAAALPDPQDGPPPRQHRRLAPHRARRDAAPSSAPSSSQSLEEGQVIDGVVKNITDYGAFVDLGGIDGLLHVTDIAWRRVNHPTEVLTIGQTVKVQIIKINHETHRISPRHEAARRPIRGRASRPSTRSAPSSRAASPTSPTTAPSSSWSPASRA